MLTINFTPFPVLTTERLILRQLAATDDNEIFAIRADENVNKYIGRAKATSIQDARTFISKINENIAANESLYWAITLKTSDKLIGTICYWNIERENDLAEIGYELSPDFQGKGLMQEAIAAVIRFGFEQMKLAVITACPSFDNTRSIQLLKKNHFSLNKQSMNEAAPDDSSNLVTYILVNKKG